MAHRQIERDTAYVAGKVAAEDYLRAAEEDDHENEMAWYGLRISEIPEKLHEEFKAGFQYAMDNHGYANYTWTSELARMRIKRLIEGRKQPEEIDATLMVNPRTVDRVNQWLMVEATLDIDSFINVALDAFALWYEGMFDSGPDQDITETVLKDHLARAVLGTTYWDIIDEGNEVHYSE